MNLEHTFAAWVDHHDPAALSRVFDATAGRLLLLATHVSSDASSAEDLLQATFLAAMRARDTWDRGRPLWPWLATILHNEARMELRRRRRRREVSIGAAGDTAAAVADPARLAESEEAFGAVVEAIDGMPLQYRQVLRLRLVHGLRNVEIARALEVPVGTVRARVHRGLARLRAALPTGVASMAACWLASEGALLAQVRVEVMAHAAELQAVGTGAAGVATTPASPLLIGGLCTMHSKSLVWFAVGAALVLLLAFAMHNPALPRDTPASPTPPMRFRGAAPGAAENERRTTGEAAIHRTEAATPTWPLIVTVKRPSGEPIAGANVHVWAAARGGEYRDTGVHDELASGRTAADGTYRCELDPIRDLTGLNRRSSVLCVSARHGARYADSILALPRVSTPRDFDTEIVLEPAFRVVGRAFDSGGARVAGARIYQVSALSGAPSERFERTGVDGRFDVSLPGPDPGLGLLVSHSGRGTAIAKFPEHTAARATDSTIDVGDVVLEQFGRIRGRVVLADGIGLGGFPVLVRELDAAMLAAIARDPAVLVRPILGNNGDRLQWSDGHFVHTITRSFTAADGSFCCVGLDPDRAYAVSVFDTTMQKISVLARPGDAPVLLTVDRQLLTLDVRDESGARLPGANIAARGFDPASKRAKERAARGFSPEPSVVARFYPTDAHGRRLLLSPFGWDWRIGSFDEIARDEPLLHTATAGIHRVERTLVLREETRFGALDLSVVDEQGKPWRQFGFVLRCLDRELERNHRRLIPPADAVLNVRDLLAGRWQLTTYLGQELFFPLEIHARGHLTQELVVEADTTTAVRVVARPAGVVRLLLHSATPPAGRVWSELRIRIGQDGVDLPYRAYDRANPLQSPSKPRYGVPLVCGTALTPGAHEIAIDAHGYRTARVRVTVAADRCVTEQVEMMRN
ncbi:MAG: sigma-70 family RNA polymerase sigma factor [Planctomycetes bacterium]|nr:sigma-70 family RNA polymerase sigma factor [Planctomycetota bacterium]